MSTHNEPALRYLVQMGISPILAESIFNRLPGLAAELDRSHGVTIDQILIIIQLSIGSVPVLKREDKDPELDDQEWQRKYPDRIRTKNEDGSITYSSKPIVYPQGIKNPDGSYSWPGR